MSKSQQNYLDQVAQRLHLTADAQSGILFGMQGGLHMMLAMTYVGYRLDWAITVAKYFEASLTDSYRAIPYLIDEEILDGGVYTGELIKLYAFTLIGAIPTIISSVKNRKMAKVTYRMQSQRAVNSTPEF